MAADLLDADVTAFLHSRIDSVTELEILNLFIGNPASALSIDLVNKELRSNEAAITIVLSVLVQKQFFVRRSDQFHAGKALLEERDLIDRVLRAYRDRRVAVIALIYDKPTEQIKAFARAFKMRKDS